MLAAVSSRNRNVILAVVTRIGVVLALLAISVSIYMLLVRTRKQPAMVDPTVAMAQIAVIEIKPVPIARQWQGFGTANPARGGAVNIPAQVRSVVSHIPPSTAPGATVSQGQVLVLLDDADFRYEVEHSRQRIAEIESQIEQVNVEFRSWIERLELVQEDVSIANADLERVLQAQERGSATQREVDQMRTALIVAQRNEVQVREQLDRIAPRQRQLEAISAQQQAALQLAERNLARCTITSPIDGILQSVDVERGESVGMDQRVARVVDLRRIEVPLRLPTSARAHIRPGDDAIVHAAGASSAQWPAVISRIAPEDDPQTRTMTVYVEIEQNPDDRSILTPGKFVQGIVDSSDVKDRIILPRRAVHADRIWVVDPEGRIRSRRVEAAFNVRGSFPQFGIDDQTWVVVNDPLPLGSLVVLDAARSLVEGTRIEPVIAGREDEAGLAARQDHEGRSTSDAEVVP
jgi:RND family efflux transporter MFP subunit